MTGADTGGNMRRLGIVLAAVLAGCTARSAPPAPPAASAPASTVAVATAPPAASAGDPVEGLRVATRVGCAGCHGKDGTGRFLWEDPGNYKVSSPNITVKRELYDDAALATFLHTGKTHDGHQPFLMPFVMFAHLSDREVRDITAWLRALPAASNPKPTQTWQSDAVKPQALAGSYKGQVIWRADPSVHAPAAPPTAQLALGKHLAMTSCSECHGPDLNGYQGEDAPPLVVAKGYSAENFARLMRTGITAAGSNSTSGLMSAVGRERFPAMTDDEVRALKAYLDAR